MLLPALIVFDLLCFGGPRVDTIISTGARHLVEAPSVQRSAMQIAEELANRPIRPGTAIGGRVTSGSRVVFDPSEVPSGVSVLAPDLEDWGAVQRKVMKFLPAHKRHQIATQRALDDALRTEPIKMGETISNDGFLFGMFAVPVGPGIVTELRILKGVKSPGGHSNVFNLDDGFGMLVSGELRVGAHRGQRHLVISDASGTLASATRVIDSINPERLSVRQLVANGSSISEASTIFAGMHLRAIAPEIPVRFVSFEHLP